MPIMFNSLLLDAGLSLGDVRLLRHKDQRATKGRTPYELWRDERLKFEIYQSTQATGNRTNLKAPFWASFVGTPNGATLFAGLYAVKYLGVNQSDQPWPHAEGVDLAGTCDNYGLTLLPHIADLGGKLFIDWGPGMRKWIQRADNQNKQITELHPEFKEPDFPGYLNVIVTLSLIEGLPPEWIAALKNARGVYLLTCPKTKERYVGAAYGEDGFWGRWQQYAHDGHGGNVALKNREPSDFQVSIREVAGSALGEKEIINCEGRWKKKLLSELNLN